MMGMETIPFFNVNKQVTVTIGLAYSFNNCTIVTEVINLKQCLTIHLFSDNPSQIVLRWKPGRQINRTQLKQLQEMEGKDVLMNFDKIGGKDQYVIKGIFDVVTVNEENKTITLCVI